jgi:hypothetical protein
MKFSIGDLVYNNVFGWGIVRNILPDMKIPIRVEFYIDKHVGNRNCRVFICDNDVSFLTKEEAVGIPLPLILNKE